MFNIMVVYPDGTSKLITGGNSSPQKPVPFTLEDAEATVAQMRERAEQKGALLQFEVVAG